MKSSNIGGQAVLEGIMLRNGGGESVGGGGAVGGGGGGWGRGAWRGGERAGGKCGVPWGLSPRRWGERSSGGLTPHWFRLMAASLCQAARTCAHKFGPGMGFGPFIYSIGLFLH